MQDERTTGSIRSLLSRLAEMGCARRWSGWQWPLTKPGLMTTRMNPGLPTAEAPDSNGLVDFLTQGDNCICVDHLFDFPAMIDDHEVYGDRNRIGWAVDHAGSRAIRIYRIGSGARRPVL